MDLKQMKKDFIEGLKMPFELYAIIFVIITALVYVFQMNTNKVQVVNQGEEKEKYACPEGYRLNMSTKRCEGSAFAENQLLNNEAICMEGFRYNSQDDNCIQERKNDGF